MQRHIFKRKRNIILALCLLLFLSACKSEELQTLEQVAVLQLSTAREVSRSSQDKGTAMGKPIYAAIRIDYEPLAPNTQQAVYDEIVTILINNGWQAEPSNIVPNFFDASIQQNNLKLSVNVWLDSEKNLVRVKFSE